MMKDIIKFFIIILLLIVICSCSRYKTLTLRSYFYGNNYVIDDRFIDKSNENMKLLKGKLNFNNLVLYIDSLQKKTGDSSEFIKYLSNNNLGISCKNINVNNNNNVNYFLELLKERLNLIKEYNYKHKGQLVLKYGNYENLYSISLLYRSSFYNCLFYNECDIEILFTLDNDSIIFKSIKIPSIDHS